APRPSDVVTLGARSLQQGRAAERGYPVAGSAFGAAPSQTPTTWTCGQGHARPVAYRPTSSTSAGRPAVTGARRPTQEDEMSKLRREQATFKDEVRAESRRNSWMAIPVLAPMAVPLLSEGAALLTGRLATSALNRTPLNLTGREPGLA